jgi:uncharacterized alpha/beta hydrolase family protein
MTAASEASDLVRSATLHAQCGDTSNRRQNIMIFLLALVFVLIIMVRVHAGEYHSRPANAPRQAENTKTPNVPGSCLHGYTGLVRVQTGQETDSLCQAYRGGDDVSESQAM